MNEDQRKQAIANAAAALDHFLDQQIEVAREKQHAKIDSHRNGRTPGDTDERS